MKRNVMLTLIALLLPPPAALKASDQSSRPAAARLERVELMHPREGWDVTDWAVSFRWKCQCDEKSGWSVLKYQLQVADEPSFAAPRLDHIVEAPHDPAKPKYWFWRQMSWQPQQLLPAGSWFWRVRVADEPGGPWSPPATFRVNPEHTVIAPRLELSASHPLFVFDMFNLETSDTPWAAYWSFIPDDLKPCVAFQINRFGVGAPGNDVDYIACVQRAAEAGARVCIGTGGPDKPVGHYADLAEIEWLFQHCPSVLGVTIGETFWGYGERARQEQVYYQRLLPLCAKYGRFLIQGDGNWERFDWDRLFAGERFDPALLRQCAAIFVPCPKTNIHYSYFEAASAVMGGWLAGLAGNMGIWSEAWYWHDVGFTEPFAAPLREGNLRKMPAIFWNQQMLTGVAAGATVLKFGGESSVTELGGYDAASDRFDRPAIGADYTALWDARGHKTPILDRYIVPFLRGLVKHELIPTRTDVLKEIRLAVLPGAPADRHDQAADFGDYAPLYRATYGIRDYVKLDRAANNPAFSFALPGRKVRFVRIEKPGYGLVSLAEVQVFSGNRNIATNGVANQSSVALGGVAKRAIDGNTDGQWTSGSVSHTKTESNPWWELDLGSPQAVDRVQVFCRNDRGNYAHIRAPSLGWRILLLDDQRHVVRNLNPNDTADSRPSLGAEYEVLPNSGRYYFIPVLPRGTPALPGVEAIRLGDLAGEEAVKASFDARYPVRSTGDAWVAQVGGRVFVMNSHENRNEAQEYSISFDGGHCLRRLSGTALPHWYFMGRRSDDGCGFWFQANANLKGPYTDGRQTRVVLECARQPLLEVSPIEAIMRRTWNTQSNTLDLVLSHGAGPVEVTIHEH